MNILDKVLDAYYFVRFKVEDAIDEIKFKLYNLKDGVQNDLESFVEKPAKKKKAKSKKKKK